MYYTIFSTKPLVYIRKPFQLDSNLAVAEISLGLPLHGFLLEVVTLVVELLATCEANLYFDPAVLEIDLKGHQGVALGLDLAGQLHDLALVQEQAPLSEWLAVENIAFLVGADIHSLYESFAVINGDIGLLDAALALADGLHLCSEQFDPRLILLFYEIIVVSLLVVGNQLDRFLGAHFLPFLSLCFLRPVCLPDLPARILPVRSRNSFFLPFLLPFSLSGPDPFLPSSRFEKCL